MVPPTISISSCGTNGTATAGSPTDYDINVVVSDFAGTGAHPFYATTPITDSRVQLLYRASELTTNGMSASGSVINAISFWITTPNYTQTFNNYTVKLGCTSTSFVTGLWLTPTLSTVYSGNFTATTPGGGGWGQPEDPE